MDKRAIEILRALACEYQQQTALFPHYVLPASELASCFSDLEDVYLTQAGGIDNATKKFKDHIAAIRLYFDELQAKSHDDPWSNDALRNSEFWSNIRLEARAALGAIGEGEGLAPDLSFLSYVPGKTQQLFAPLRNKELLLAYSVRQLVFVAIIAGLVWVHFLVTGEWMGWPLIIITAILLNIAWCFVA